MNYTIGLHGDDDHTDLILVNPGGDICARRTAIGCNPDLYLDQDTIRSVLIEKLDELAAHARSKHPAAVIAHTALCLPGSLKFWQGIVARLHHFSPASAHPDYMPALEQATHGQPGIVLSCDPLRSLVAARGRDQRLHCAGNLGCRLSDPGSDYDLGRRALVRTLAELQGWAEPSELGRLVSETMKGSDTTLLPIKLDGPAVTHRQIAELAVHVLKQAAAGEAPARTLVRTAVRDLARLAIPVLDALFDQTNLPPIGLHGAILQTDIARQVLPEVLGPGVKFVPITAAPSEGLRLFLKRISH